MRILGIETSCDETAAAVVENGRVLSNVVSSQVHLHEQYRGIVPELASRAHLQKIAPVIEAALGGIGGVDAVAYTRGPGLMGPLLVGKVAAQALAQIMGLPLIGVNHLEGHIFAVELAYALEFPLLALIVSGGHTDLVLCRAPGRYRVLGRTRDDAAGEAFDKVARLLGLGYPGGPHIDRRARKGDPAAVAFPRPIMPQTWDFSFAGLKTAVLYHLQRTVDARHPTAGARHPARPTVDARHPAGARHIEEQRISDICASFQAAVVETLATKAIWAAERFQVRQIVLGGGVAANSALRSELALRGAAKGFRVSTPPPSLCTDNGAMIAQAAWHRLRAGKIPKERACDPSLGFQNWAK